MAQPQLSTRFITPMPTPGSPHAPRFKEKRVNDFLDSVEAFARSAGIEFNDLPAYVLRYCNKRVRYVIESAPHWKEHDWSATRAYLVKLYGLNEKKRHVTPDKLRKWIKKHSSKKAFSRLQDIDWYYREFTAQASRLIASSQLSEEDANILFFRGILKSQQKGIRRKLPAAQTKIQSPPPWDDVLALLQKEFDEDNIVEDTGSSDSSSDMDGSDSEGSSDESDSEEEKPAKTSQKSKKKVRFSAKKTSPVPVVDSSSPSAIESLAKQMQELQLGQTRQIQELQQSQANILRELATARAAASNSSSNRRSCFICDKNDEHRLEIHNCPKVRSLIDEGLVAFTPEGRLMRPGGGQLP
jgi:hypothetical protein